MQTTESSNHSVGAEAEECIQSAPQRDVSDNKSYSELYKSFRKNGLGLVDSAYNALYIYASEKSSKKERRLKKEFEHIARHPAGWYGDDRKYTRNSVYDVILSVLENFASERITEKVSHPGDEKCKAGLVKRIFGFIRRNFAYISPAVSAAIAVFVISSYFPMNIDIVANVNGNRIGFVESKSDVDRVIEEIEEDASDILGYAFKYPAKVTYSIESRNEKKDLFVSSLTLKNTFETYTADYIKEGHGLYIDGELFAASSDKETLVNAVNTALEIGKELNPGANNVSFANEITYSEDIYPVTSFKSEAKLVRMLSEDVYSVYSRSELETEEVKNTVISASFGNSAEAEENEDKVSAYYIDSKTLADAMSDMDEAGSVHAAFKINRDLEYTEMISYSVVYKDDPDSYVGTEYVETEGKNGLMNVLAEVTYVDGKEVKRTIKEKAVLEDKTDKVIVRGTRLYPENDPNAGKKVFFSPIGDDTIIVTSKFGWRSIFYTSSSNYHNGMDIETDYRTPVYAAMSGEVVAVVTGHSSYGNYIDVKHPNGMLTRYAHLGHVGRRTEKFTGFACEVGDIVKQGQLIAYAGDTGRVSGTHLHFEVRNEYGNSVDPKLYLAVKKYIYAY